MKNESNTLLDRLIRWHPLSRLSIKAMTEMIENFRVEVAGTSPYPSNYRRTKSERRDGFVRLHFSPCTAFALIFPALW